MLADNFINNSNCYCSITTIDTEQEDGLLIKDDEVIGCRAWATSVTIPNKITSIGNFAFQDCSGLTSVTIPNNVKSIGELAFYNCSSLTSIYIPKNVGNIGSSAFSGCSSLFSITVDEDNAFYDSRNNCNAIICKEDNLLINGCKNTTIPDGVTRIGTGAFTRCYDLKSISIPNSVSRIDLDAFSDCHALNSITIPNSVTFISYLAFCHCINLKDVTIHVNSNLHICSMAFEGTGIENLIMYGETLPEYTENLWVNNKDFYNTTTLHVPSALYDEYSSTSPWNKFKKIVKLPDEPINLVDGETFTNKKERNGQEISYTRTFNNTSWQALYIPFSLNYNDWKDDFEVAYINGVRQLDKDDNGTIDETIMDVIKIKSGSTSPNMPYLIKAKKTDKKTFSVSNTTLYPAEENSVDCSTTIAKYTFTGTYNAIPSATMIANKYYAMGGGQLITSDGSNDLKPYRWYMKVESRNPSYNVSNAAKTITINVIDEEGETTGVEELRMANDESPVYDLNGRKVNENNLKPGIYVKNGKKFVVK